MDEKTALELTLDRTAGQIGVLDSGETPEKRPNLADVESDIDQLQLTGGPADAIGFHDVHVLKMAFEHVWAELFDQSLREDVEQFYLELTRLYDDAGLQVPDFSAVTDIASLQSFLRGLSTEPVSKTPPKSGSLNLRFTLPTISGGTAPGAAAPVHIPPPPMPQLTVPSDIAQAFPEVVGLWPILPLPHKQAVQEQTNIWFNAANPEQARAAKDTVTFIIAQAQGQLGRLQTLIAQLSSSLSKPYMFDVFAPGTYNFGIMLTYRQRWEPLSYQAGDLVASIPLAPGENRKYAKRRVVKKARAQREVERSMRSRSEQSSEEGRSEWEIMKRSSSSSNFKMTSEGTFNVGIGSISASSQFGANQAAESADTKRQFHQRTLKAAQDYKLERSLEVDTSENQEFDESNSGEIANPNTELTVTYLFYELQRRYQVSEAIHRARPVILVARDVPAPHEITEAWLIEYQWILSRVLLDDLFRPALDYLTEGLVAEELNSEVLKANFDAQRRLVDKLEGEVAAQLTLRASLRDMLIETSLRISRAEAAKMPTAAKVFTLGMAPDPGQTAVDQLEASRAAGETRLKYVEEALADAQAKLKSASEALTNASKEYAEALKRRTTKSIAVDQLQLHVKDNIIYYMHAIWDHEPPDQRFFELYDKKVKVPTAPAASTVTLSTAAQPFASPASIVDWHNTIRWSAPKFDLKDERQLVEIADLDNPLGYKGNYTIFPLTQQLDITTFMMADFLDDYLEVNDPDGMGLWSIEKAETWLTEVLNDPSLPSAQKNEAKRRFAQKLSETRRASDVIIVPTGQLFVEALPGRHPLLEDFKLRHRLIDLRRAAADARHVELENLRLAVRVIKGHGNEELLEDPDVEKRIIVEGAPSTTVGTGGN